MMSVLMIFLLTLHLRDLCNHEASPCLGRVAEPINTVGGVVIEGHSIARLFDLGGVYKSSSFGVRTVITHGNSVCPCVYRRSSS